MGRLGTRAEFGIFVAVASILAGCGDPANSDVAQIGQELVSASSQVTFAGCTEFAGIGFVPRAKARALVPAEYELSGDESNAVIVVRVADCDEVSVSGRQPKSATVAQVGISVLPVDPTADINNYTLWFGTNLGQLHGKLRSMGVDSELDANLAYDFVPTSPGAGSLSIESSPPKGPDYSVTGTAITPTAAPVPFVATWWAETAQGAVRMRTEFPEIRFGGASMTLTTAPGSCLATLIGSSTLTFALLDSYNAFDAAELTIDVP